MTAVVPTQKSTIVRPTIGELTIRVLEPADVSLIEEMSADLSPESLAQRFFVGTPVIPRALLSALRRVDHARHEAVVATVGGRVVGLAEYVLVAAPAGPSTAEFAVMVADRWQKAGIGRQLVGRLAQLALARGIPGFEASVLPENLRARRMIAAFWPAVTPTRDEDCLHYELPLRSALARLTA